MDYDPTIFHHLLRHRYGQFPTASISSSALDTIEGPYLPLVIQESGGPAARSLVRRAEEDPRALQRPVLRLRWRQGSAPLQPAADRRRPDQASLAVAPMPPFLSSLAIRLNLADALGLRAAAWRARAADRRAISRRFAIMIWSEDRRRCRCRLSSWPGRCSISSGSCCCGRPGLSAVLSLACSIALVVLSQFKFHILWMTASFIDVMIIDSDTFAFLAMVFPKIRPAGALGRDRRGAGRCVLLWRFDPLRVRLPHGRSSAPPRA